MERFDRAQDPRELTRDTVFSWNTTQVREPVISGGSVQSPVGKPPVIRVHVDDERPPEETGLCESPTDVTPHTQQYPHNSDLSVSPFRRMTAFLGRNHSKTSPAVEKRSEPVGANIVIFGETGVGKSSVVNLIAGQKLAHTSNSARGCTFRHEQHPISWINTPCTLWDTVGLDEGSEGTVPAKEAENNLKELMQTLAHLGGIHLIIYCIRGTRLTKALKRNYRLFYITVCRRKVPVALVVTCLEHQRCDMESWWNANEAELLRNGMWFDAHACVTTLDVADNDIQQRRSLSEKLLRDLVAQYSGHPGWKSDSISSRFMPQFHNVLRGRVNSGNTKTPRKVLVCSSISGFLPGTNTVLQWDKGTANIGNRQYEFLRVDKDSLRTIKPKNCVGAGLLLFYSDWNENWLKSSDVAALREFFGTVDAKIRPVIVVLQGCDDDEQVIKDYDIALRRLDIQVHFAPIRSINDTGARLIEMIEIMCMEQAEVKTRKFWKRNN